jgi:Integrase core domain
VVVITDWKHEYNHHRRHSALGYLAPANYAATCTHHYRFSPVVDQARGSGQRGE